MACVLQRRREHPVAQMWGGCSFSRTQDSFCSFSLRVCVSPFATLSAPFPTHVVHSVLSLLPMPLFTLFSEKQEFPTPLSGPASKPSILTSGFERDLPLPVTSAWTLSSVYGPPKAQKPSCAIYISLHSPTYPTHCRATICFLSHPNLPPGTSWKKLSLLVDFACLITLKGKLSSAGGFQTIDFSDKIKNETVCKKKKKREERRVSPGIFLKLPKYIPHSVFQSNHGQNNAWGQ